MPISVSAGIFANFFGKNIEQNINKASSLQNMHLLVANTSPLNENFNFERLIDGNALVALSGPSGSVLDIENSSRESDQISVYVVREGDTISEIANMFGVTVNTIKWGNDLTSNTLKAEQNLVILPISGIKYTIKKGDSVTSIAKKFKADEKEIISYNNIESDLVVGENLIIPDGELATAPSSNSITSIRNAGGNSLKIFEGYYMRPVVQGKRSQGIHGYNGVDIAAPSGTPIFASASGEVIISRSGSWNGGYGNYVVIKHPNGTQTLYAHNKTNLVSVGDMVKQGDIIGYVGATGKATGNHLHFEVRGAKNPF
ncbi:MAG: peptidoglycan DD-metalloendopeptidase family protein [Patescibacteria group bacterium]